MTNKMHFRPRTRLRQPEKEDGGESVPRGPPSGPAEIAAAMAEAEEAEEAKEKEKEGGIASVAGARRRMEARK